MDMPTPMQVILLLVGFWLAYQVLKYMVGFVGRMVQIAVSLLFIVVVIGSAAYLFTSF